MNQSYMLLTLHDLNFTTEIFDGFENQTVAQLLWERMKAEILNCNCKISDAHVNKNLANLHVIVFCYFCNE